MHRKVAGNGLFGFRFHFHFWCCNIVLGSLFNLLVYSFAFVIFRFVCCLCVCVCAPGVHVFAVCYHQCWLIPFLHRFRFSSHVIRSVFSAIGVSTLCLPFMRFKTKFYCRFLGFGQFLFFTGQSMLSFVHNFFVERFLSEVLLGWLSLGYLLQSTAFFLSFFCYICSRFFLCVC